MGSEMPAAGWRWWQTWTAWTLWMLAMLSVWLVIHWYNSVSTMTSAEEALVSMCDERARMLQDQFAVSVNHVHALAVLISTFHYQKDPSAMDQDTFAFYTGMTAFERPLLNGVAYAQRVLHSERGKFESLQGWIIRTMKQEPSPVQNEYAPVIFSQETVSYLEVIDMMSGEEDRENILRARATGKAVLTNPFRLLESNHLGVVLTLPVYRLGLPADATIEGRIEATAGYLGGAFDVESLVENLLRKLAGNQDIVVNVYDVTNISNPLTMYGLENLEGYTLLTHVSMLDFGDPFRKHQMVCRYSQKPTMPWSAITSPSGLVVILMLVAYILYAAQKRYVMVMEDCRKMEELKVQAEAADIAKSQFLATVSHEIRTPMNGVLGMLDMLLDTDLNLPQKDYAQTAQVCGKALIALINEVLDRAKIEAGKLEIEAVPFDLRAILDDVLSLFSAKSREKGIELAALVSNSVPEVLTGDPGRFRQIITNLVGNSVKFTERGHILVQVHLSRQSDIAIEGMSSTCLNGKVDEVEAMSSGRKINTLSGFEAADDRNSWENFKLLLSNESSQAAVSLNGFSSDKKSKNVSLIVSVEDSGIGIPFNAQDRVFTPFMQADSSTSRNYGGTGIGLSISKCLVELMGGRIHFISRPNVGSTFTFTAVLEQCIGSAGGDLKRSPSEDLPICFKGMKIVLLDQRPVRSAVTSYHLHRLGIGVEVAENSMMALDILSRKNGCSKKEKMPMILFLEKDFWSDIDVCLRKQLLEWKQTRRIPELPKIILLGTSECDKVKGESFADLVIMKPLRASAVAVCLKQAVGIENQMRKELPYGLVFLRSILMGKNILVVDDNKVNLRVAAAALKKYGAKVECAESGKVALSLLKLPHKFDACFMDVQMPEMDGFEATRQVRIMEVEANEQAKSGDASHHGCYSESTQWHLPILAMTADVIQATYEECMKCGMDGYVSKPFDEEQLSQAVAKFVASKPVSDL
ncbi:probable histidine kinase 6 [Phalaenopsis equestris]|uniref:probable histidine kinase 6 n=1 Tax=Phalaenopsis equestris TaxID=78828 RepID=UPI0009E2B40E|nr:probable histidine kinase 6 [Phalaenopsis equestris]